jgi:hypothetical protein
MDLDATPAGSALRGPFSLIAAAYYLLPGEYEWEPGHQRELLAVLLFPIIGFAGFCLATGRLAALLGTSLNAKLLAGALLVLVAVPLLHQLPRVVAATGPSLLLVTGLLNSPLLQLHVPFWMAWCLMSALSLIFAARLYVFLGPTHDVRVPAHCSLRLSVATHSMWYVWGNMSTGWTSCRV